MPQEEVRGVDGGAGGATLSGRKDDMETDTTDAERRGDSNSSIG